MRRILRVGSLNLHGGSHNRHKCIRFLRAQQPFDALALQEVDESDVGKVAAALGMHYVAARASYKAAWDIYVVCYGDEHEETLDAKRRFHESGGDPKKTRPSEETGSWPRSP